MNFEYITPPQDLPLGAKTPNAQTQAAMRDADAWVAAMRAGTVTLTDQSTEILLNGCSNGRLKTV